MASVAGNSAAMASVVFQAVAGDANDRGFIWMDAALSKLVFCVTPAVTPPAVSVKIAFRFGKQP